MPELSWLRRCQAGAGAVVLALLMAACSAPERNAGMAEEFPSTVELDPVQGLFSLDFARAERSTLGLQASPDVVAPKNIPQFAEEAAEALDADLMQTGSASWYGDKFHGRLTANGERYNMHALTAAHRSLPFGTQVCVRGLLTGKEVLVRINDRGPFSGNRIIDLSRGAAEKLGMLQLGLKEVALWIPEKSGPRCGDGNADLAGLAANSTPQTQQD